MQVIVNMQAKNAVSIDMYLTDALIKVYEYNYGFTLCIQAHQGISWWNQATCSNLGSVIYLSWAS